MTLDKKVKRKVGPEGPFQVDCPECGRPAQYFPAIEGKRTALVLCRCMGILMTPPDEYPTYAEWVEDMENQP